MKTGSKETIQQACSDRGLDLEKRQLRQIDEYAALLEAANRTVNLVSRREQAPLLTRHIFHSLLIGFFHSFTAGEKVLDIGTGGGLPGIPLSIAFPDTQFLLIDATGKKINACRRMIETLGLKNVHAIKTRAEELKGVVFDTVLSRQVAPLQILCGYAHRLLNPEGTLVCLKGGNLDEEVSKALADAAGNNGFPADISLHPIDEFDECFLDKYVVIASDRVRQEKAKTKKP